MITPQILVQLEQHINKKLSSDGDSSSSFSLPILLKHEQEQELPLTEEEIEYLTNYFDGYYGPDNWEKVMVFRESLIGERFSFSYYTMKRLDWEAPKKHLSEIQDYLRTYHNSKALGNPLFLRNKKISADV
jgi:hypothetical protein